MRLHALLMGAVASVALSAQADDGLAQTTISFYADGKPVGGMIFAIGAKTELRAKANHIDEDENIAAARPALS